MMDVSGTDPRTRTGLFLWPWASYPAVAANAAANAHSQPIMMGAGSSVGANMGANMLGVPNSGTGPLNVPSMMDDPFETFYQRLSYPSAHAAHMSHMLPQQQQLGSNESRHISQERSLDNPGGMPTNSSSPQPLCATRSHSNSTQRILSPQSRSSHLNRSGDPNITAPNELINSCGISEHASEPSSRAAAIAAFASVAANSGVMGSGDMISGSRGSLGLPPSMHGSRHMQAPNRMAATNEMVLDSLCNGLGKSQFPGPLPSSGSSGLLNGQSSIGSPSSGPDSSSPITKTQSDTLSAYGLRCQNLKDFSNTAAAALAAAVAGDHAQFAAHVAAHGIGKECVGDDGRSRTGKNLDRDGNRRSSSDDQNDGLRVQVSSEPSAEAYPVSQQQHYLFSPKSPLSDSCELSMAAAAAASNALINQTANRSSVDFKRNGRLMSGLRDKSASLLFRSSSVRDCSPDAPSGDYHSSGLLMSAALSARECMQSVRSDSSLGVTPEDTTSSTGQCNAECSMSALSNTPGPYTHPAKGYKCKICQHVCFSRHDLSAHNAATHKQDPRPYRCEQCGRQFSTCAYLSQHRRIHTGVKPYACRYCDRRFTQLSHVQQHERIHTGEKPYRCTTCMKSFTQMSNLQSHQRQHMKGKPHRCEQCFMSFDSKDELDVHVQAKHSGNRYAKVLVCPICTKSYNSETYLAKHMDRHKEAVTTSTGGSGTGGNDGLNGLGAGQPPTACVDDLFGFHNRSMAMAAAASAALSRGSPGDGPLHVSRQHGHSHSQHQQQQQQVASAAAAAVAAAAHRAAAAAAAAAGNRGELVDGVVNHPFFNNAACSVGGGGGSESRVSTPSECSALHNDPLNYSAVPDSDLLHHLPASLHGSQAAAHLMAAAAAQQQQQQQPTHPNQMGPFSKLAQNSNRFSDFRSQNSFLHAANNMNPRQELGQQQQQQHYGDTTHSLDKRELENLQMSDAQSLTRSSSGRSPLSASHPYASESPGDHNNEQQLLNLTRSQQQLLSASSASSSSPAGFGQSAEQAQRSFSPNPHQQEQQEQNRVRMDAQLAGSTQMNSMVPPPAHQHCSRPDSDVCGALSSIQGQPQRDCRSAFELEANFRRANSVRSNSRSPNLPPGVSNLADPPRRSGSASDAQNESQQRYLSRPPDLSPPASPMTGGQQANQLVSGTGELQHQQSSEACCYQDGNAEVKPTQLGGFLSEKSLNPTGACDNHTADSIMSLRRTEGTTRVASTFDFLMQPAKHIVDSGRNCEDDRRGNTLITNGTSASGLTGSQCLKEEDGRAEVTTRNPDAMVSLSRGPGTDRQSRSLADVIHTDFPAELAKISPPNRVVRGRECEHVGAESSGTLGIDNLLDQEAKLRVSSDYHRTCSHPAPSYSLSDSHIDVSQHSGGEPNSTSTNANACGELTIRQPNARSHPVYEATPLSNITPSSPGSCTENRERGTKNSWPSHEVHALMQQQQPSSDDDDELEGEVRNDQLGANPLFSMSHSTQAKCMQQNHHQQQQQQQQQRKTDMPKNSTAKPDCLNVPFYLDSSWPHYHSQDSQMKAKDDVKREDSYSGEDSVSQGKVFHPQMLLGPAKRRRRAHHDVSQHLSSTDGDEVVEQESTEGREHDSAYSPPSSSYFNGQQQQQLELGNSVRYNEGPLASKHPSTTAAEFLNNSSNNNNNNTNGSNNSHSTEGENEDEQGSNDQVVMERLNSTDSTNASAFTGPQTSSAAPSKPVNPSSSSSNNSSSFNSMCNFPSFQF
ncbi:unnamed protein product [Calicophoron daubneyi]|uniref:C2H2-type domain-containing protein n=1 Tax=Calicophoron daubneyi TaxID=300641 RepID=A0AAV2T2N0_CALDB